MKSEIFENEDGKFIVFPNDAIAQHLKTGKLWESHYKKVVLHIIPTNAVVLDCGANFGYNAVVLANTINIAQMILYMILLPSKMVRMYILFKFQKMHLTLIKVV
jgi:hypothetical protein